MKKVGAKDRRRSIIRKKIRPGRGDELGWVRKEKEKEMEGGVGGWRGMEE